MYIAIIPRLTQLTITMITFLQGLPHLLVCSCQVVTRFHLNISTVEVVDTGHHLYFPIKVVFIMVIIPFFPSLSDETPWVWGLRLLCNYLLNTCTLKSFSGIVFSNRSVLEYLAPIILDFAISQVQTNPRNI